LLWRDNWQGIPISLLLRNGYSASQMKLSTKFTQSRGLRLNLFCDALKRCLQEYCFSGATFGQIVQSMIKTLGLFLFCHQATQVLSCWSHVQKENSQNHLSWSVFQSHRHKIEETCIYVTASYYRHRCAFFGRDCLKGIWWENSERKLEKLSRYSAYRECCKGLAFKGRKKTGLLLKTKAQPQGIFGCRKFQREAHMVKHSYKQLIMSKKWYHPCIASIEVISSMHSLNI
jgi:hypothetical protein